MNRSLRWHERLLVQLLVRSPRIDALLILQMPGATAAERNLRAALTLQKLEHQARVDRLEQLYQSQRQQGS